MLLRFFTTKSLQNECYNAVKALAGHDECLDSPPSMLFSLKDLVGILSFLCHCIMSVLQNIRMCCIINAKYNNEYLIMSC